MAAPFVERLTEPLWLGRALRAARAFGKEQQERVAALASAARSRADAAAQLGTERAAAPALVLLREAVLLYAAALRALRDATWAGTMSPPEAAEHVDACIAEGTLVAPDGWADVRARLLGDDTLAFDRLPVQEATALVRASVGVADWLDSQIDVRSPRRIQVSRALRLGAVAAVLVAAAAAGVARLTRPTNIALGKNVTASSRYPGTPKATGATDGDIVGAYGVHTRIEDAAWIAVDLGALRRIRSVRVYNRGDGYFDDALPLRLQLSKDGKRYVDAGTRATHFSQSDPWIAEVGGQEARWVRVIRKAPGYVALSEIEVYE